MLQNILNQPASIARVIAYQQGEGAAGLHRAAASLRAARRVVFTGMGSSLFASIPPACLLAEHGIAAEAVDTSELLYFYRRSLSPDTAVVLVSRSGESVEILRLLPLLKEAGVTVVAVTNVPDSRLAREVPNALLVNSDPDRMVAVQTYTGTLTAMLMLAAAVVAQTIAAEPLVGALSDSISDCLARRGEWKDFLAGAPVVYLLGRGPSLASACEGGLLLSEASRTPAIAMSAAQFRHGPVEVVDERFRALVFASASPAQELDTALAVDLQRLGGQVRVSSGDAAPPPFAPVLEIVPVEVAACVLAEWKGFEPGLFRFASQVTSAETGFSGGRS